MKLRFAYALRTLVGPWLVLPVVALEVVTFLQRGMPWLGEGMWTVDWFAISLFLIGPVCTGVAAVDAARLSRPGNLHLVVSVPKPARVYLRAAAWCAVPLIAVHLVAIAVGMLVGAVRHPSVGWWPMLGDALVQCLVIVWYTALGSAIGRLTTPLLAGLLGGAGGFILSYVLGDAGAGAHFQPLAVGAATVSRIGLTYNPGYLVGQAVVLSATALLFLFLPLRIRSGYRTPALRGAIFGVVAVGIVIVASATLPARRLASAEPAPPTYCVGSAPQVCLYYEHRRFAERIARDIEVLSRAAKDNGYDVLVPATVAEASRSYVATGDKVAAIWLPAELYEEDTFSTDELALQLVEPKHCPELRSVKPPSNEYYSRIFSVLKTWLSLAHVEVDHGFPLPAKVLAPAEVEKILSEFKRCDLSGSA